MSNFLISPPLSRSELHSAVQPAVNAFGNHASTTQCPLQILAEGVGLAVRGRKREVRRLIPDLQLRGTSAPRAWSGPGRDSRTAPHAATASDSRPSTPHACLIPSPPLAFRERTTLPQVRIRTMMSRHECETNSGAARGVRHCVDPRGCLQLRVEVDAAGAERRTRSI